MQSEQVPDDSLTALTSDGLPVTLDLSIRFPIDPDNVWKLHQQIGPDFVDRVVRPQSRSVARMTFAGFPVVDVSSGKRQAIIDGIATQLREKFKQNDLVLDAVLLRDIRFSPEFQATIEQKQIAQRMRYVLEKEQQEKRRKIILAEGEAESIRRKGAAIATNPRVVAYQYVQKVAPNIRTILSSGNVPLTTVGTDKP